MPVPNQLGQRRQYTSYYPGCDGFTFPCYPRMETDCEMRRRITEPDWTKPVCNPDGSYREYQCEAHSRSKCWCVYENGMMIEGKTWIFSFELIVILCVRV